jgi:hypothetical protein
MANIVVKNKRSFQTMCNGQRMTDIKSHMSKFVINCSVRPIVHIDVKKRFHLITVRAR